MTASAVYKWSCPNFRTHYIGSSSRNLYVRAAEHAGLSYRTGQPLSSPPQSSIRDHAVICSSIQYINSDNFQIIGTSKNTTELRILESIFIKRETPPPLSTTLSVPFRSALLKYVIFVLIRNTFFNLLNNLRISVIFNPVALKFKCYSFSSVKRFYIFFLVLDSLDSYFLVPRNGNFLVYTLFSVKVTNIYLSFIADDARIMVKRPY